MYRDNQPRGVKMKKEEKRFLVRFATGAVVVILALACMKQCREKRIAIIERDQVTNIADSIGKRAAMDAGELQSTRDSLDCAYDQIYDLEDTLVVRDSLINQLRDSLNTVNKNLDDCRNSKKTVKKAKSAKKPCVPCESKKQVVKKTTTDTAKPCPQTAADAKQNAKPETTNVNFGCGAHDNTVNVNNGTVNNYYGAAAEAATKTARVQRASCVTNQVVRCR